MTKNEFEWDDAKAASNLVKHGVSFEEAVTVFNDYGVVFLDDTEHSTYDERREIAIGYSARNRMLTVIFTERHVIARIISARFSIPKERKIYENK